MTSQPRRIRPPLGPVAISLVAGVLVLLSGLFVNGCRISKLLSRSGAEGGSGGLINVVPREVRDSAIAGTSVMRIANLAVTNSGGWLATGSDAWIHVAATNSGARGSVRLSLDPKSLEPGMHEGSVTVQEREGDVSVSVPVRFFIQQPILAVDPHSFNFTAHSSADVFHDTLEVTNAGNGPLVWTVTTEHQSGWLSLDSTAGTGNGTIAVRATNEGLSYFGTYNETIIVSAPGAKNSPQRIQVTMKRKRHGD